MTPTRLAECLDTLGWSRTTLADRLGVERGRVQKWAEGVRPIPAEVGAWLEACAAALRALPPPQVRRAA